MNPFGQAISTPSPFGGNSQSGFSINQANSAFGASAHSFGNNQINVGFHAVQSGSDGNKQPGSGFGGTQIGYKQPGGGFGGAQSGSGFGNKQPGSGFGGAQSGSSFGIKQPGSGFGGAQSGSGFGNKQPGSGFGGAQSGSGFGNKQSGSGFGGAQNGSGFGNKQSGSGFGGAQSGSGFGSQQPGSGFGGTQSGSGFGTSSVSPVRRKAPGGKGAGNGRQGRRTMAPLQPPPPEPQSSPQQTSSPLTSGARVDVQTWKSISPLSPSNDTPASYQDFQWGGQPVSQSSFPGWQTPVKQIGGAPSNNIIQGKGGRASKGNEKGGSRGDSAGKGKGDSAAKGRGDSAGKGKGDKFGKRGSTKRGKGERGIEQPEFTGKMKISGLPSDWEVPVLTAKLKEALTPFGPPHHIKVVLGNTSYAWVNFVGAQGNSNATKAAETLQNTDLFATGIPVFCRASPVKPREKQAKDSRLLAQVATHVPRSSPAKPESPLQTALPAVTFNLNSTRESSNPLKVGDEVMAVADEDGQWYQAVVVGTGEKGLDVSFPDFEDTVEWGKRNKDVRFMTKEEKAAAFSIDDDAKDADYEDEDFECAAGCGLFSHRNPPDHFTEEDAPYCCSLCRTSRGKRHGGHCEGRPIEEEEEESQDPWSESSLKAVQYSTDDAPKPENCPKLTSLKMDQGTLSSRANRFASLSSAPSSFSTSFPSPSISNALHINDRLTSPVQVRAPASGETVIVGQCEDMSYVTDPRLEVCDRFEKGYEEYGLTWRDTACKKHKRSAAGYVWDPLEVRTDAALYRTVNYVIDSIADVDTAPSARIKNNFNGCPYTLEVPYLVQTLGGVVEGQTCLYVKVWKYAWNRLRAVRVDFKIQGYFGVEPKVSPTAVEAYELMARFHCTLHSELQGCEVFDRDRVQDAAEGPVQMVKFEHSDKNSREAITEILTELQQLYETALDRGDLTLLGSRGVEGMAQCMGYMLLQNMENDDGMWLASFVRKLNQHDPITHVLTSAPIRFAISVCVARHRQDFASFFRLLKAAPYVEACIMTKYLDCSDKRSDGGMRYIAVRSLHRAWGRGPKNMKNLVSLRMLSELLCLDEQVAPDFFGEFGLTVSTDSESGEQFLEFGGSDAEFEGFPHQQKTPEEAILNRKAEPWILRKRNPTTKELKRDSVTGNYIFEISRARISRDLDIPSVSLGEAGLTFISAAAGVAALGSAAPQVEVFTSRPSIASELLLQIGETPFSCDDQEKMIAQAEAPRKKLEEAQGMAEKNKLAEEVVAREKREAEAIRKQNLLAKEKDRKEKEVQALAKKEELARAEAEKARIAKAKQDAEIEAIKLAEDEKQRVIKEQLKVKADEARKLQEDRELRRAAIEQAERIRQQERRASLLHGWVRLRDYVMATHKRQSALLGSGSLKRSRANSQKLALLIPWRRWCREHLRVVRQRTLVEQKKLLMKQTIADIDIGISPILQKLSLSPQKSFLDSWQKGMPTRHPREPLRGFVSNLDEPKVFCGAENPDSEIVRRRGREEEKEEEMMLAIDLIKTATFSKRMKVSSYPFSVSNKRMQTTEQQQVTVDMTRTPKRKPAPLGLTPSSGEKVHVEVVDQVTAAAQRALASVVAQSQAEKPRHLWAEVVRRNALQTCHLGKLTNENLEFERRLKALCVVPESHGRSLTSKAKPSTAEPRRRENKSFEDKLKSLCS